MSTISVDPQLQAIEEKLVSIEKDLSDPKHYVNDLLANNAPKKNFYKTWAEILEQKCILLNTPEKIPEISNTIRRKLISLNRERQINWMYDALPFKYKQHKYNPRHEIPITLVQPTNNSSKSYEKENKLYLDMLDNHITACKAIRRKLEYKEFLSKKDENGNLLLSPDRVASDIKILEAADRLMTDMWDDRKAVSVYTQHFLVAMVTRFNTGYATGTYLGYIKDFGAKAMNKSVKVLDNLLSPKQVTKITRGLGKDLHKRYDPKNKDEAQSMGFYGDQCTACESWRVEYETVYNEENDTIDKKCRCYGCNETWAPVLEMLPNANQGGLRIDREESY